MARTVKNGRMLKILIIAFSIILAIFSIVFWIYCNYMNTASYPFLPPITTIALWISIFIVCFLLFSKEKIEKIFGHKGEVRKSILDSLGVIFMAFILLLTLSWNLAPTAQIPHVLYFQSVILVGILVYFALFFYYILVYRLPNNQN